jgi:hypothetical protein
MFLPASSTNGMSTCQQQLAFQLSQSSELQAPSCTTAIQLSQTADQLSHSADDDPHGIGCCILVLHD